MSNHPTIIDARQQFHDRSEEHCWQLLRGTLHQSDAGGQVIILATAKHQQRGARRGAA